MQKPAIRFVVYLISLLVMHLLFINDSFIKTLAVSVLGAASLLLIDAFFSRKYDKQIKKEIAANDATIQKLKR